MPGTVFTADQVVNKLRQIEVLQGGGKIGAAALQGGWDYGP
jgi:hypothetical protein